MKPSDLLAPKTDVRLSQLLTSSRGGAAKHPTREVKAAVTRGSLMNRRASIGAKVQTGVMNAELSDVHKQVRYVSIIGSFVVYSNGKIICVFLWILN